jgi:hypothetical protein
LPIRLAALAALLILGGCSPQAGGETAANDPYAGLDGEILKWRTEIVNNDALCQSRVEGQACESFEISCKAQLAITPKDQAAGVTAKLVAALNWNGFDPATKQTQPVVRSAEFRKAGGVWTRAEHTPVNPSTCAVL